MRKFLLISTINIAIKIEFRLSIMYFHFLKLGDLFMRINTVLIFISLMAFAGNNYAEERTRHDHKTMPRASSNATPLTEPGNDAFAAIQEAVDELMSNPNTDWRRVNLEALRQHLVDMDNFTLHVVVVSQLDGELQDRISGTVDFHQMRA